MNDELQRQFGYPRLATPANSALESAGIVLPDQRPLPELLEPNAPIVTNPVDEPMQRVVHPRIRVVPFYALGGWTNAIEDCWLRSEVLDRLSAAVESLPTQFGLVVYDGWRPPSLQAELYNTAATDSSLPPDFLAEPSVDATRPAPHESGGAIDLTLSVNGVSIAPGTDFDDTTNAACAASFESSPGADRDVRRLLFWTMQSQGFIVFRDEWWHFEYGTRRWAAIVGEAPKFGPIKPPE